VSPEPQPQATEPCWVITDGTAGMENQALGLAERLGLKVAVKRVALRWPWNILASHLPVSPFKLVSTSSDRIDSPWPRIAIGCGRQSIPFMRAIRKASSGRTITVQCQHPRVNPAIFDLVIPPEHDGLTGPNVLPLLGSPNRISPASLEKARAHFASRFEKLRSPRIAVLLGGKNKAYRFGTKEAEALAQALAALAKTSGLMITASRRTGAANVAIIRRALEGTDAIIWDGEGENPYQGLLAWADAFIVTADSVNMACEAAATGKPVHIYPLPGGSAKFRQFHESLAKRGIARVFTGKIEHWTYPKLDETGRAAAAILKLLDLSRVSSDIRG
jgi:mitochondrial fission protein ELM1